jgi:hypothetical protein
MLMMGTSKVALHYSVAVEGVRGKRYRFRPQKMATLTFSASWSSSRMTIVFAARLELR